MRRTIFCILTFISSLLITACPGGGGDSEGGGDTGNPSEEIAVLSVDLYGAQALFSMQSQSSTTSSESAAISPEITPEVTVSTQSPLIAVTSDGLKNALRAYSPTNTSESRLSVVPNLSYVAISPNGNVYLAFERKFLYTDTANGISISDYSDPNSPSSPFTCQIFKVNKNINEFTADDVSNPPGVTCVTDAMELDTWDARSSRIQFDAEGNAYLSAHYPNNWKNILMMISTDGSLSEVINANICFRDFVVTDSGAVLYTGITSTSGNCDGEDSFLRYMTPERELQEVTRGWWNYTFTPIEEGGYAGQVYFYGPDPTVATVPDWDDSCLFRFNPAVSGASRSTSIADCEIDIELYVNGSDVAESSRPTRCGEEKNMMGGGNQPEKILLADADGDGADEVYVVGNIYVKREGAWKCDFCIDNAGTGKCVDSNHRITDDNQGTCTGTWYADNSCYNNVESDVSSGPCVQSSNTYNTWGWNLNHTWCQAPGNEWRLTYSAMARVNDDANKTIDILSDNADETVTNGWTIGDRIAYSAFNTLEGTFKLIEVDEGGGNSELLSGIEVYELFEDPRDSSKWFLNGLRFSDNTYIMGSFDPDDPNPSNTLDVDTGVTGQIETLVIVPQL